MIAPRVRMRVLRQLRSQRRTAAGGAGRAASDATCRRRFVALRMAAWCALGATLLSLDGCGLAALPCRVTAATLDVLPVVGHAAAEPFNVCASTVD